MRIHGTDKDVEKEVKSFLCNYLSPVYEVISEYKGLMGEQYDLAILRMKKVVALIETKRGAQMWTINPRIIDSYHHKRLMLGAKYFVVTDGDDYCILSEGVNKFIILKGEDFIQNITNDYPMESVAKTSLEIANTIVELASKFSLVATQTFLKRTPELFISNPTTATISFSSVDFEDKFFKSLLYPIHMNELCRFTSLDRLFEMIKHEQQTMCNLVCMNDRSEGLYADKKVFGRHMSVNEQSFAESDCCYILSLMDKSKADDLTMWRLYGNDAKGACLLYKITSPELKKKPSNNNFFLAKVSYGRLVDNVELHPQLSFLHDLVNTASFGPGWSFVFQRWGIWKHFFKSYLFADEKEIRLLLFDEEVKGQSVWIKNPVSQIVTKMKVFNIQNFPLKPHKITIGPKCPENDLVARQYGLMLQEKKALSNIEIAPSKIKDYR